MPNSPFQERELEYDPFDVKETQRTSAADDALTGEQFDRLVEGARNLDRFVEGESELVIYLAGRLGMRRTEIVHMQTAWIDWDNEWIEIPDHEPCTKGKDGGICGSCRSKAKQMAEINDAPQEELEGLFWKAKTVRAARSIPYSFDPHIEGLLEPYFDRFDEIKMSAGALHHRVKRAAEEAPGDDLPRVTPHTLRATSAMHHVETGIDMWGLQSFFGWAYPNTARRYILNNSRRTKKQLEERHGLTER